MNESNSSKDRYTAVNDDSVVSISKLSRIRLDTTLYTCLDIVNKISRCSVHKWHGM